MKTHHTLLGLATLAIALSATVDAQVASIAKNRKPARPPISRSPDENLLERLRASPYTPPEFVIESPVATRPVATLASGGVFSNAQRAQSVSPSSTTLSPPVSITYAGASPAVSIDDTGSGKALQAIINNSSNTSSALYGQSNGAGGGVTGYNGGTTGFAGKFGNTNNATTQPAVLATNSGTGPVIVATTSNSSNVGPTIYGRTTKGFAVSAEATASGMGVKAIASSGTAVAASSSTGVGVLAASGTSYALQAQTTSGRVAIVATALGTSDQTGIEVSSTGTGVYADSQSGTGVFGSSEVNDGTGVGVQGYSFGNGIGVEGSSDFGTGVAGFTEGGHAIHGIDYGSGVAVYGYSNSGYAGYFDGTVAANTFQTLSDRNAKSNLQPVDGKDLLARVNRLAISTWDFKTAPTIRHLGPMAQDFHAQFGLAGDDDRHISLTDITGVSLAAIQELSRQADLRDAAKDAKIAALEAQVVKLTRLVETRLAALQGDAAPTRQRLAVRAPSGVVARDTSL